MAQKIIRLCYRKIIDAASTSAWDKLAFDSTYTEFRMQAQLFNQGNAYKTFGEILLNNPSAAQLHFLVSAAITGYVQQLQGVVPDITDSLGRRCLTFKQYRFEIINSDVVNSEAHQIAINFFSEPMLWHATIGNYLLLSHLSALGTDDGLPTHQLELKPFLSISSLKETI